MNSPDIQVVRSPLSLWLRGWRGYVEVTVGIASVTLIGWCFTPLSYRALGQIYLLAVIALSLRVGRWPALAAAVVSGMAWEYFFVPPRWSFAVSSLDDNLLLGTYFVVALVGGQLTARVHEREKHQAQAELHRTLLDCVSHELKTPLAVLRSAGGKIDTDDAAKRARLAAEIRTATLRLDHLVANLLNQTRLESGGLHSQPDWCDARDIIGAARRVIGDALADRPLQIEIPGDLPLFRADAALLEQAVANLLHNVAVHTPASTPVHVTAGVSPYGAEIYLRVADGGPGIPPELRGHLFQKFRRGDAARAGGLGLGLAIVRGFMHAQGGEVVAEDNPGGGASFTLRLPNIKHGGVPEDES